MTKYRFTLAGIATLTTAGALVFACTAIAPDPTANASTTSAEQTSASATSSDASASSADATTDTKKTKVAKAKPVKITISAAGDCTLGTDSNFVYSWSLNAMYARKGPAYFMKRVKKTFASDDLSIVNLEGTLTSRGTRSNTTFAFRGKPRFTKILKKGSIEAVTFANNHMYDYGKVSYKDTINNVSKAGIKIASLSRISTYKAKGVKVGMIAVCAGIDGRSSYAASKRYIKTGMKKLKKRGCKIFIVSMHNGVEKQNYPNSLQKSLAKYAIDKGADLVLGAHPHVLQGIQKYHGAYIVYSLANFCFGGNSNPSDKDTMIYRQTFKVTGKKVKAGKARVIPCRVTSASSYNNYQPIVAKGSTRSRILRRINSYSSPFGMHFNKRGVATK